MKEKVARRWITLLILAIGAGIIYQLPYIRETFYVPLQEAMGITNEQMGVLSSGYATVATLCYFIGGIVADKFSVRKLLTFSFISTGILGLYFSTFPGYGISRLIFVLWGITTIVTYWPALIKATRNLGDSSEQGRMFGFLEGLRGISNSILVFLMFAVFDYLGSGVLGVTWAIRTCSISAIIVGFLSWFFIEDSNPAGETESISDLLKGLGQVIKMPKVWIICGIIFTTYSVYGLLGYIGPYMVRVYGAPVETSIILGGTRYIIQAVGGVLGGLLADKIGSRLKVLMAGYIGIILSFGAYMLFPDNPSIITALMVNFYLGAFVVYVMRSLYFAIIDDAGIDISLTGRVSGLASCIGYTPDIFMFAMVGRWIDMHAGRYGYMMMFAYGIAMSIIGFGLGLILLNQIKKSNKRVTSAGATN
ncbi:MFS transporter [Tepidanaerobacter syntrophicus]|uniref:MFS transporter n=1 Tax=Tepidanaerobacter syntrophicus TaxID=224999 RepID=UPI001BD5AFD4|nr:MFS transporter [Tepidanaerobacter syntrophicus]